MYGFLCAISVYSVSLWLMVNQPTTATQSTLRSHRDSVRIDHIHHKPPRTILLLPDANVTTALDHRLRIICDFIRAVCVTKISGARYVAPYWTPLKLSFRSGQCVRRRFTAEERKITRAVEPDVRRCVGNKRLNQSFFESLIRILEIATNQRFECACRVDCLTSPLFRRFSRL